MTRLSGWEEIKGYVKRSETTLRKWEQNHNFPVIRLCGCVESDTESIDRWWRRMVEKNQNNEPA